MYVFISLVLYVPGLILLYRNIPFIHTLIYTLVRTHSFLFLDIRFKCGASESVENAQEVAGWRLFRILYRKLTKGVREFEKMHSFSSGENRVMMS